MQQIRLRKWNNSIVIKDNIAKGDLCILFMSMNCFVKKNIFNQNQQISLARWRTNQNFINRFSCRIELLKKFDEKNERWWYCDVRVDLQFRLNFTKWEKLTQNDVSSFLLSMFDWRKIRKKVNYDSVCSKKMIQSWNITIVNALWRIL